MGGRLFLKSSQIRRLRTKIDSVIVLFFYFFFVILVDFVRECQTLYKEIGYYMCALKNRITHENIFVREEVRKLTEDKEELSLSIPSQRR